MSVFAGILLCSSIGAQTQRPDLLAKLNLPVRYQMVFGQRMAYYETGRASAPPVILIPSLGWDGNAWAQNINELSRSYRVIIIEPLGTGRSDKPLIDYKMDTWTDCFAEFMRLKHIDRAAFAGAVMGGALSVQMALDHPEKVSAVVVAASNSGPGKHEGGVNSPTFGPSLKGVRASLLEAFFDDTLVTDSVVRAIFTHRISTNEGYTVQRHLADHRAPYSPEELSRIKVPALFVWCREDVTTPLSWGEDFSKALPGSKLNVIERCGHYPNIEQPMEFDRVVSQFLQAALR